MSSSFWARRLQAIRTVAPVAGLVAIPVVLWVFLLDFTVGEGDLGIDFHTYYGDAEALLDGEPPPSPYPPIVAVLTVPFTLLPIDTAEVVATVLMALCAVGTLWVLGIRDWRCYAALLLWGPVFSGVQTGNASLPLTLGLALLWRWRDRPVPAGVTTALVVVSKLFLWPVGIWLLATRRLRAVVVAAGVAIVASAASWALVGLDTAGDYGDTLESSVDEHVDRAYTIVALMREAGAPDAVAYGLCWLVGAAIIVAALRSRDEARSYTLFIAAALVLSPVVWLHFLVLLLVPLALLRPRFDPVWLAPLPLWIVPPTGGSTGQKLLLLAVGAFVVAAVLRRPAVTAAPAGA